MKKTLPTQLPISTGLALPQAFPFGTDASETQAEFKQRLQNLFKNPILAGHVTLVDNQYNALSQILPIQIQWEQWSQPFQYKVGNTHVCLHASHLRALLKSTQTYAVYAQLKLVQSEQMTGSESIFIKITGLHLKNKNYIIPIYHQLPPTLLYSLDGHQNWTKAVSFSHQNSPLLASASEDNTIRLWKMGSGQTSMTLKTDSGVNSIAFSPDGKLLASGSNDTLIRLWDIETGKEHHVLQGHEYTVFSVAFSPNGQILASGSVDKTVRLWDVHTGCELFTLRGHDSWIFSVAFSPDGRYLASGSRDKTVKLWDVSNGLELLSLPHM